jgi:hypothetical protein
MTNRRAISRATLETGGMSGGGILGTQQFRQFFEDMFDSDALMRMVRRVPMEAAVQQIDKIGIASRIAFGATENDTNVANRLRVPTFSKVTLTAKKYMLPWALTDEVNEDNIEGQSIEDRIARMMATQFGLDILDVAINGDDTTGAATTVAVNVDGTSDPVNVTVASVTGFPRTGTAGYLLIGTENLLYEYVDTATNTFVNCHRAQDGTTIAAHVAPAAVTWEKHLLIGNDDGWMTKLYTAGGNYIDGSAINGGDLEKGHLHALKREMPNKYRSGNLVYVMNPIQADFWSEYLTNRATGAGDAELQGQPRMKPLGIPIVECSKFPEDMIALTNPQNLIIGVHREVKIEKAARDMTSIFQQLQAYAASLRCDFEIQETNAVTYLDGLTVA